MDATLSSDLERHSDLHLDDLPVGTMRMIKVDGHRVCLVRTSDGLHAIDHACPHEGYGLTQGDLDGDLVTCAWHNWKFRVTDGVCVQGEEGVQTHHVSDEETLILRFPSSFFNSLNGYCINEDEEITTQRFIFFKGTQLLYNYIMSVRRLQKFVG